MKNREFFCYGEIFLPNTRGPLGCLLGFWSSGPKPCGGKYCCLNLRLRQACGQWSSSLVFLNRVLAKTTLTITKTSFENKLLLICDYFAIALISYDRILHNVGDVRYNYGLVCPPIDQIQRVTVCKKGNFMLSQIKCARNCSKMRTARAARLFFTIRTIKFFLFYCLVIRSIYTGIKMGQTSIRSISVPHSSFEFILDQKV